MVTVMLLVPIFDDCLATYDTLSEAIDATREYWMEEPEGPQAFAIVGEGGECLATLMRGDEPEVCHTLYRDGTRESHRCRYVLDSEGGYERTEVALA